MREAKSHKPEFLISFTLRNSLEEILDMLFFQRSCGLLFQLELPFFLSFLSVSFFPPDCLGCSIFGVIS
jgi:hypothetical protein